MATIKIFDPTDKDKLSSLRGGGRIMQILKENLSQQAQFINNLTELRPRDTLIIPSFNPFTKPILSKRLTRKQLIMIFDTIPLKYPDQFPSGYKGAFNLWRNKLALSNFDKIITISQHSKTDISEYLNVPGEKIEVVYPCLSNLFLNSKSQTLNTKQILNPNIQNSKQKRLENLNLENSDLFSISDLDISTSQYCLYVGDVNWNKNLVNLARAIKIADIPCVFVGKVFSALSQSNKKIFAASQLSERVNPDGAPANWRGRTRDERSRHDVGTRVDLARKSLLLTLSHPWQMEFKQFTDEVGDDKRFIFAGFVPDDQLINLYQNAVCNILVSRDEGFGYSYLEAASQHTPSVLSDTRIFNEIAADSALYADPKNSQNIADMINQFTNLQVREIYGKKAYTRSKFFSPLSFTQKILSLLE